MISLILAKFLLPFPVCPLHCLWHRWPDLVSLCIPSRNSAGHINGVWEIHSLSCSITISCLLFWDHTPLSDKKTLCICMQRTSFMSFHIGELRLGFKENNSKDEMKPVSTFCLCFTELLSVHAVSSGLSHWCLYLWCCQSSPLGDRVQWKH